MEHDDLAESITQFVSITGIAADQARFFVESAGGNLETALSTYYETVGTTNAGAPAPNTSAPVAAPAAPSGPTTLSGQPAAEMPAEWRRPPTGSNNSSRNNPRSGGITSFGDLAGSRSAPAPASRVRGISTLKDITSSSGMSGGGDMSEDDDDDDADGPPDLYAGGGRSGLNVQDPNQQSSGKAGGIVADILKKANEAGQAPPPVNNAAAAKSSPFFQGAAQTLGSDDVPSRPVPPPAQAGSTRRQPRAFPTALPVPGHFNSGDLDEEDGNQDEEEEEEEDEEVEKHLTFWKDGFSIENGPLLSYDDPKHKKILEAINRGSAPLDLLNVKLNQRVTIRVQKRLTENYIPPPKPPAKPFDGSGNRLGSPLPSSIVRPADSQPAPPPAHLAVLPGQSSSMVFEVDNNLPVTSVQIRLADGSRMVTRFNHTHTIGDIRRQIAASNPSLAERAYALQTTFPSRDLTDDNQTIKEAGVLGSVVVQRFM